VCARGRERTPAPESACASGVCERETESERETEREKRARVRERGREWTEVMNRERKRMCLCA